MDKLLSLKETEKLLNVSKSTLQRWDNSGKLKAIRTEGGHRRYKQSDIDEILKTKDGITYRNLYEHLCSAQYIADSLQDDDANAILKIRERIGQKLLNEYNKDGSETIYEVKPYKYNDEWISRKDGWDNIC